jgi:hypothetical protein
MRLSSDPAVVAWLDRQIFETLCLISVNLSQLLAGVEILPAGSRRNAHKAPWKNSSQSSWGRPF